MMQSGYTVKRYSDVPKTITLTRDRIFQLRFCRSLIWLKAIGELMILFKLWKTDAKQNGTVYHRAKHTRYKLEAFVAECEPFARVPSGNGHSNRKPKTASSSVGDSPGDPQKKHF